MKHKCITCNKEIKELPDIWDQETPYSAKLLCTHCIKQRRNK